MAIPGVMKAKHLGDFRVLLSFSDGLENTLVWPNGADFAPEFLREKASVATKRIQPERRE